MDNVLFFSISLFIPNLLCFWGAAIVWEYMHRPTQDKGSSL